MRQIVIEVPAGEKRRVLDAARRRNASNVSSWSASNADGDEIDVVVLHLSNSAVEPLLVDVEGIDGLHVSLIPRAALAMQPPPERVAEQVTDVEPRSPLEVYLAGLQSIGDWKGFLAYAGVSGVVVWVGLVTNSISLLVGAMLLAPYAGPAINTAIGTARGDWDLLWRSVARYGGALATTTAVAAVLSLIYGQDVPTDLMVAVSRVSLVAVALPLAAGAAAALHLSQGDDRSLVSGAAAGILVAALLAPQAGLIGISLVSGDLQMIPGALFTLVLQLAGINVAAAGVLHIFGLRPRGVRYDRGNRGVRAGALAVSGLVVAGLLAVQFLSDSPELERSTVEQRARSAVLARLEQDPVLDVIEANARFTRARVPGQNSLLIVLYIQPRSGAPTDDALRERAAALALAAVKEREWNVTALVSVNVVRTANARGSDAGDVELSGR
jgi:uncharacterized membrane protein